MNISEILNAVYDEDVGWRPASGAIKPVHVANGLARALQELYYDATGLNRFLVWWRQGGRVDEDRTYDALLRDDRAGIFRALAHSPKEFERARRYALGLLGADKAVFPSAEHCSFSLTSGRMATRDNNDRGLGDFAAHLLDRRDGSASLGRVVAESLEAAAPQDPVSALVWPLLSAEGKAYARRADRAGRALKQRHNKEVLAALSAAASDLATHERAQGNRLRTLQRAVHFVCVATHAHAQALAAGGDLAKRPPALIAMSGRRRSEIALTSERSLDNIYDRLESWLADRLADRIERGSPLAGEEGLGRIERVDGRSIRPLLGRISAPAANADEVVDARMADFQAAREAMPNDRPARILAHALVASYAREAKGGPKPFLQGLGRKAGLLYPHFAGRAPHKRVRPNVPILDMLVRACVPAGETVALDEFLARLWDRFGLMVGGRRGEDWDDASVLADAGLTVDTEYLVQNTEEFVEELVAIGLARRYPDHVTFVGDGYAA